MGTQNTDIFGQAIEGAEPLAEPKKRGRPRGRKPKEDKHYTKAQIIERAKQGIDITDTKAMHFKSDEDFAESRKAILELIYEASLPKVQNDEELATRFTEYFHRCASSDRIPTIEELMLCTGYGYKTMASVRTGRLKLAWSTDNTPQILAWATEIVKAYDAKMVMAGKLPQIPYIFRSKNYYGMSDRTEVQVVQERAEIQPDINDIAKRYGVETTFVDDEESSSEN